MIFRTSDFGLSESFIYTVFQWSSNNSQFQIRKSNPKYLSILNMPYNPDDETSTVIATVSANIVFGIANYLLFEYLRYQKEIYFPRTRSHPDRCPPLPSLGAFSWIFTVLSVSDRETLRMVGVDAYICLRFLKLCLKICVYCGTFGVFILFPVYFTSFGQQKGIAGINLYTMGNIEPGGNRLWASAIACWVFNLYCLYELDIEYKNFIHLRQKYMYEGDSDIEPQTNYSIMVENIPAYFCTEARFKKLFEEFFPNQVFCVSITRTVNDLDKLLAEGVEILGKLESAIAYHESNLSKGEDTWRVINVKRESRDETWVSCFGAEKVDAIEYYKQKLNEINSRLVEMQTTIRTTCEEENNCLMPPESALDNPLLQGVANEVGTSVDVEKGHISGEFSMTYSDDDVNNTEDVQLYPKKMFKVPIDVTKLIRGRQLGTALSTGFVTFTNRRAQTTSYQLNVISDIYTKIKIRQAPSLADIEWTNMHWTTANVEKGKFITSGVFSLGILFWGSVLAFIAAISNLSNLEKYLPFVGNLDPVLYAIVAGLLPVIVMNIFLGLLPAIFAFGARRIEGRKTKSEIDNEVFQWFFGYQLANVYLTLLSGSVFSALSDALADPTSIISSLAAALPSVSVFFINYIITSIISGGPNDLLNPIPVFIFNVYRILFNEKELTQRQLFEGPLANVEPSYGEMLPTFLFIFCIVLTYWVIAPFLLVLGALYFCVQYTIMKYKFLYIYVPAFETGGKFWFGIHKYSMIGLMVSSVTMIGYMGVKQGILQASVVTPIPAVIYYCWGKTLEKYEKLATNMAFSRAVQADMLKEDQLQEIAQDFKTDFYMESSLKPINPLKEAPYRLDSNSILLNKDGTISPEYVEPIYFNL